MTKKAPLIPKAKKQLKDLKTAQKKHKKTLQLPSTTLVATSAMVAAREACEAKVDAIVKECLENNTRFRDSKFDLLNDKKSCLYSSLISETVYHVTGVKRVGDLFRNPVFFLNGASPDDIKQGSVGDCWFVAALATVSNIPGLLEQLCVKRNEQVGVYGFIFFKDGDWVSTVVDDQLFYVMNEIDCKKSLAFSSCLEERETWLPLMEKAYAKIHGDYETLSGGFTSEGIEDLTGGIASIMFVSDILDKNRFWEEQMKQVNKGMLMGCSINVVDGELEKHGILPSHAYSVLNVAEFDGERLVHLRNPWGRVEWNGDWADDSEKWTPEAMKQLNFEDKNDGRFWLPYRDFLRIFTTVDICKVFDSTWSVASSWIPYNVEPRSSGKFEFTLTTASDVVIVLTQPDERYYGAFGAQYTNTLAFHLYDQNGALVKRAKITVPYSHRSVNCELHDLPAGEYRVVPHVKREPTDVIPEEDDENDEDDEGGDDAISPSLKMGIELEEEETMKMDKVSYMFQQRKAGMVRSMSMARVTGKTLLGVDDEDYEEEDDSAKVAAEDDEKNWQLMLGLRIYSHDPEVVLVGTAGTHPGLKKNSEEDDEDDEEQWEDVEEGDPEAVTATLADKSKSEHKKMAKEE